MLNLGAFSRNSPILSLVILVSLGVILTSTIYNLTAFTPSQFENLPATENYKQNIQGVVALDEWTRTQFYWRNNLSLAASYAVWFPTYSGFVGNVANGNAVGVAIAHYNAIGGSRYALAFTAEIFVHGLLELTGIFLITTSTSRLAWKFWTWTGEAARRSKKGWTLEKILEKDLRNKKSIRQEILDFLTLFGFALILIIIAAPIESYISPEFVLLFFFEPVLAVLFIGATVAFYLAIAKIGFRKMLRELNEVWGEISLAIHGKFRMSQLPIIMFIILVSILMVRFFLI